MFALVELVERDEPRGEGERLVRPAHREPRAAPSRSTAAEMLAAAPLRAEPGFEGGARLDVDPLEEVLSERRDLDRFDPGGRSASTSTNASQAAQDDRIAADLDRTAGATGATRRGSSAAHRAGHRRRRTAARRGARTGAWVTIRYARRAHAFQPRGPATLPVNSIQGAPSRWMPIASTRRAPSPLGARDGRSRLARPNPCPMDVDRARGQGSGASPVHRPTSFSALGPLARSAEVRHRRRASGQIERVWLRHIGGRLTGRWLERCVAGGVVLVMAVLLGGLRVSSPSFESARVTWRGAPGIETAGRLRRPAVSSGLLRELGGNCAMIPSLSMSAMCRIWTWTSS